MHTYIEVTDSIEVHVTPQYLSEDSDPERSQYLFSYHVEIVNNSGAPIQLLARHWIITDGYGYVEVVKGAGVVGEQPKLNPGARHRYQSFCPLPTPSGNMRGTYLIKGPQEELFEIKIPLFFLRTDYSIH